MSEEVPLSGRLRSRLGARARLRPPGKPSSGSPGLEAGCAPLEAEQGETALRFKITPDEISHSISSLCNLRGSKAPVPCAMHSCSVFLSSPSSGDRAGPRSGKRTGSRGARPGLGACRPAPCAAAGTSTRFCRKPNSASGNV